MSIYESSVPVFVDVLSNLSGMVMKALAHCEKNRIDPEVLSNFRLYPDMWPLMKQVETVCDQAAKACARLTGTEINPLPPTTGLAGLPGLIEATIAWIQDLPKEQFASAAALEIVLPVRGGMRFTGETYLREFALPNVYFHATIAYAILRHCGVEIGKSDFLGWDRSAR